MPIKTPWQRVFLASLPLLFTVDDLRAAFFLGASVAIMYWGLSLFFYITRRLFPVTLFPVAVFLTFAILVQAGIYYADMKPFWIVSVMLLMPHGFLEGEMRPPKRKRALKGKDFIPFMMTGLGFFGLLIYVGLARQIFCNTFGIWIFAHPVGVLILLVAAAMFWQSSQVVDKRNQSGRGVRL